MFALLLLRVWPLLVPLLAYSLQLLIDFLNVFHGLGHLIFKVLRTPQLHPLLQCILAPVLFIIPCVLIKELFYFSIVWGILYYRDWLGDLWFVFKSVGEGWEYLIYCGSALFFIYMLRYQLSHRVLYILKVSQEWLIECLFCNLVQCVILLN
jgi:hypothetical protein